VTGTKGLNDDGLGGFQQPLEGRPVVPGGRIDVRVEISFDVVDGALQDEDLVSQSVEFAAGYDQLVLGQFQFGGTLSCYPVPLTAGL